LNTIPAYMKTRTMRKLEDNTKTMKIFQSK